MKDTREAPEDCAPITPLMLGCRRARDAFCPVTRQRMESFSLLWPWNACQAAIISGSSCAKPPSTKNMILPPLQISSMSCARAGESAAFSGSQDSKKAHRAWAALPGTSFKIFRCSSRQAAKHCRLRAGLPFASMPRQ